MTGALLTGCGSSQPSADAAQTEVVEAEKVSEEDVSSKETVIESQEEVEIEVDANNGQLYFKF